VKEKMNLQAIRSKKSLKLLFLLFTSLLIGVVSAQIYSYMYIQGSGTINAGGLSWLKGDSAPAGASIVGNTVTDLNLTVKQDSPTNFTDCLRLVNNDGTDHTYGLETSVTAGSTSDFTAFDLVVYQSSGDRIAKISIENEESVSGLTIAGSTTVYVRFEVDPLIGSTSGYMAFTVKLTYE
jgi:hypothetical protein